MSTTVELRKRRDSIENEVHLRLVNWSNAVRGGLLGYPKGESISPTPNEADARLVEDAMCEMKQFRRKQYRVLFGTYIARYWSDQSLADYCRCSVSSAKQRRREGYNWLHGKLPSIG